MRRVTDLSPANQSELFTAHRYHAVFTDSPLPTLEAEKARRAYAIVKQVNADLKDGPLAHLPSGHFWPNSAWLACAAMAFNLTRAASTLASAFHAKTTTGTIRARLIAVPGRLDPTPHPAPTDSLAPADAVATPRSRSEQPTASGLTPNRPSNRTYQTPKWRSAGPPGHPATPAPRSPDRIIDQGATADPDLDGRGQPGGRSAGCPGRA